MKLIIYPIFLLITSSCTILRYSSEFKVLKKQEVINDNKLKLNGYYFNNYEIQHPNYLPVKATYFYIFYSTGIIDRSNISSIEYDDQGIELPVDNTYKNVLKNYHKYLEQVPYKPDSYSNWGIYRINGDSIRIQYYVRAMSPWFKYDLTERKGVILNDTTFLLTKYIDYVDEEYTKDTNELYHFRKLDQKPDSTSWVIDY